jgi:hypothetical protein
MRNSERGAGMVGGVQTAVPRAFRAKENFADMWPETVNSGMRERKRAC